MAIFNRKQNTSSTGMPDEVNQYYEGERREKTWLAWLLGLTTLIVTLLIAMALYYGGRWVYRKVVDNSTTSNTSQTDTTSDTQTPSVSDDTTSDENTNPVQSSVDAPETSSTQTPVTTSSTSDLPSTGPEHILAVFCVASLVGYLAHRKFATS